MSETPLPLPIFKRGDPLLITMNGRSVEGTVKMASPNGVALFLEFDAILGGCVGQMPVIYDQRNRRWVSVMDGEQVTLEVKR